MLQYTEEEISQKLARKILVQEIALLNSLT